jgi:phosphatidylglycerol:prolipoprotein diacylglycerol transferase
MQAEGALMRFTVTDTGKGMAPEQLKEIRKALDAEKPSLQAALEPGYSGFGLRNVDMRIRLYYGKKKGLTLPLMWDTVAMGVLVGQILGRWGNFFNREVFGAYTDSPVRMAIPIQYFGQNINHLNYLLDSGIITDEMMQNPEVVNGIQCITVHPTFLYEGFLNLLVLIFIFFFRKHKKFDGEIGLIYMTGYGICRFLVEAIRTDSLMMGSLKASQVVALICVVLGLFLIMLNKKWLHDGKELKLHSYIKKEEK